MLLLKHTFNWNITLKRLPLIIDGTTEKVSQFIMLLKPVYNKSLYFVEQKCIFKR